MENTWTIILPCLKYTKQATLRLEVRTIKRILYSYDPADTPDAVTSVVVHASVPFSLAHLEEDKDAVCSEHLLPRARELVPELPPPDAVKNHKWRFSQVGGLRSCRVFAVKSRISAILANDQQYGQLLIPKPNLGGMNKFYGITEL